MFCLCFIDFGVVYDRANLAFFFFFFVFSILCARARATELSRILRRERVVALRA
jgi:hypothetical protein